MIEIANGDRFKRNFHLLATKRAKTLIALTESLIAVIPPPLDERRSREERVSYQNPCSTGAGFCAHLFIGKQVNRCAFGRHFVIVFPYVISLQSR